MINIQFIIFVSLVLFTIGFIGVIIRRNLLVILMCMELMMNSVILSLIGFSSFHRNEAGVVLTFIIFIVAAAEIAVAIPIIILLTRKKNTLDASSYMELRG